MILHRDDIEEEKRWLEEMLALSRQMPGFQNKYMLSHNEKVIRDFINGEGIFADEHQ